LKDNYLANVILRLTASLILNSALNPFRHVPIHSFWEHIKKYSLNLTILLLLPDYSTSNLWAIFLSCIKFIFVLCRLMNTVSLSKVVDLCYPRLLKYYPVLLTKKLISLAPNPISLINLNGTLSKVKKWCTTATWVSRLGESYLLDLSSARFW